MDNSLWMLLPASPENAATPLHPGMAFTVAADVVGEA